MLEYTGPVKCEEMVRLNLFYSEFRLAGMEDIKKGVLTETWFREFLLAVT